MSLHGWGAECQGLVTQGRWPQLEMDQHINVLELRAAKLALRSFRDLWQGGRVRLTLDNTTAVSQIVKMGSPRSKRCLIVTQEIWEFVLSSGSTVTAQHLPGKDNEIADFQSRVFRDSSSWRLCPEIFQGLLRLFPWLRVDLFSDGLNHQLQRYWSWRPDSHAEGVDALTTVWKGMGAYAFPPFRLILWILRKVQNEGATLLLVAPVWYQQPWYPVLLGMLSERPVLLPTSEFLLTAPDGSPHHMCVSQRLTLAACVVSGDQEKVQSFLQRQKSWLPRRGAQAPHALTSQARVNSEAGVINNRLIQFRALWRL